MDLETCIRKAQSGDVECYGEVVRLLQGRLRSFIATYCPDRDLADDIAQSTFVWAYEHLMEFRPGTRFYSWLKAIARNTLLAELESMKRSTRNRRAYLKHLQAVSCQYSLKSESGESDPELLDALRQCVKKLSSRCQWMIRRRYEERDSVNAIAERLGTTPGTVKVALFRVRRSLQKCVEGLVGKAQSVQGDG